MIKGKEIIDAVSEALIISSTKFRDDQIKAYKEAIKHETEAKARWVLEKILENAKISEQERRYPLCNDTGIPHVYLEIGQDVELPKSFFKSISDGIAKGERDLPTRPMAVKGEPLERLAQNKGLYDDPGQVVHAPIVVEVIPGDEVLVTVLMLGGGPELQARTYRVYHLQSVEHVLKETANWAIEGAARLGCTPCVPAIGIGRTHFEATASMLRALRYGRFDQQDKWETMIVDMINATGVGPLGLGGKTTALGSFIEISHQRAGGARIVCMRLGCCYDPRRATVVLG